MLAFSLAKRGDGTERDGKQQNRHSDMKDLIKFNFMTVC